ncbi:hypothetical protein FS595_05395 [Serratia rubidaea]|uniref:putative T6SS immunity periplasmic lipoprotein n=1 Tax=Serratia rubidaea TaxID=61652 RepID=UPI001F477527|nr:putative T6SS immunity periplasmic lipoprotein [Serratia rubidaea]UJD79169.1 hypothetical protein FS596_05395 [Serratia rubidaea]UJD83722.1 hypothetical protein FS595_05395 [Serratia rubidaea]
MYDLRSTLMIKRILLVGGILLLVGCPRGDHVSPEYPAHAALREQVVCITVTPEKDEQVQSVLISKSGSHKAEAFKYFESTYKVVSGECVDMLGYRFQHDESYKVSINLNSPENERKVFIPQAALLLLFSPLKK